MRSRTQVCEMLRFFSDFSQLVSLLHILISFKRKMRSRTAGKCETENKRQNYFKTVDWFNESLYQLALIIPLESGMNQFLKCFLQKLFLLPNAPVKLSRKFQRQSCSTATAKGGMLSLIARNSCSCQYFILLCST